jgi:hypothetical protein
LSFLPGNARIHAPIWVKVGAPVTKDWGICGFRLAACLGQRPRGGGFGAQAQYKSSVGPLFTNKARVVIAREQKGEEERRAVD